MSTAEGSRRIVTDGLILFSDVATYISGNTTLNDLTVNQNHGFLTGATYSGTNLGTIAFNGTSNFIDYKNPSGFFDLNVGSISVFAQSDAQVNTDYHGLLVKQERYGLFVRNSTLWTYDWGNVAGRDTGVVMTGGSWSYATLTFENISGSPSNNAKVYHNGVLVLTTTVKLLSNNSNLFLGQGDVLNQFFRGRIAMAKVYNRVLSPQEVMQNYNATRKRFGL